MDSQVLVFMTFCDDSTSVVDRPNRTFLRTADDIVTLFSYTNDSPCFNPLSAKQSFQLWYPGGQRLKVISFS